MNYYVVMFDLLICSYEPGTKIFLDSESFIGQIRLVRADNAFKAEGKLEKHFENKSKAYEKVYSPSNIQVLETIE